MINKEQWLEKLKSSVPDWFYADQNSFAILKGISAVLEAQTQTMYDHLSQTYITDAITDYLIEHGKERSKIKSVSDTEASYRSKVRNFINSCNLPAIKELVDGMLINGECSILEHYLASNFCDRGAYADRNIIETENLLYNAITISVYHQIPVPVTFVDRDFYADRSYISGATESDPLLFENIVNAVNENKAYGTVYRLIERVSKG